uniref:Uncharacterized protein n=1 Tax=Bacteriophage sp. TaxID=38018 RepID=A0A8D9PEP0_9VIRU|nr:MAG TPA: hypothetical protein [Bacteriophage sp.]
MPYKYNYLYSFNSPFFTGQSKRYYLKQDSILYCYQQLN